MEKGKTLGDMLRMVVVCVVCAANGAVWPSAGPCAKRSAAVNERIGWRKGQSIARTTDGRSSGQPAAGVSLTGKSWLLKAALEAAVPCSGMLCIAG